VVPILYLKCRWHQNVHYEHVLLTGRRCLKQYIYYLFSLIFSYLIMRTTILITTNINTSFCFQIFISLQRLLKARIFATRSEICEVVTLLSVHCPYFLLYLSIPLCHVFFFLFFFFVMGKYI
jgi:hypothetical protein